MAGRDGCKARRLTLNKKTRRGAPGFRISFGVDQ
jgi:hypothetical protein